jgi:hypothetical protein
MRNVDRFSFFAVKELLASVSVDAIVSNRDIFCGSEHDILV